MTNNWTFRLSLCNFIFVLQLKSDLHCQTNTRRNLVGILLKFRLIVGKVMGKGRIAGELSNTYFFILQTGVGYSN